MALQSPWNISRFRLPRRCLNLKPSACQRRSHSLFKSFQLPVPNPLQFLTRTNWRLQSRERFWPRTRFPSGSMIDGSERDIFQLQFPRELTPVTPGVHRGDTRNEKKRGKGRTWRSLFSLEKRSKYIDEDIVCAGEPAPENWAHRSNWLLPSDRRTVRLSSARIGNV